jgi:hypothetical protein
MGSAMMTSGAARILGLLRDREEERCRRMNRARVEGWSRCLGLVLALAGAISQGRTSTMVTSDLVDAVLGGATPRDVDQMRAAHAWRLAFGD